MAKTCKKKKLGFFSGFSLGAKCAKQPESLSLDIDGCEDESMEDYSDIDDELLGAKSFSAAPRCRSMRRSSPAPKVGSACAARVSRGSEFDTWKGLTAKTPKRNPSEHVTCTVVIYNAVSGGVPSEADVIAAIDDLEQLYAACSTNGHLADQQFDFMKKELTVKDANDIADKISAQPYKPPVQSVAGFNAFPL
jgi:hypothetical protein